MNRRKAGGITEFLLGNRKSTGVSVGQSDGPQPNQHLTKNVRDALVSLAAADIGNPLAKNGAINERCSPKGRANPWMLFYELTQQHMRYERQLAWRDGLQAAIQKIEMQAVEIRDIAGDVERHDLASTVPCHL
jgi:hypothetical protein